MRIVMSAAEDAPIRAAELRAAAAALLNDDFQTYERTPMTVEGRGGRLGSGFAHVGSIGEHGRRSYAKLTAVFGGVSFPGSNCGISILGG
jgi:hypothetical protein